MAMQSLCPTVVLPDPKADRKTAVRVEQYRLSGKAFYFPAFPSDRYLPFSALKRAWLQSSSIALTGCCGKALPVTVLRVQYEGGFYETFTFEKAEKARQVLSAMQAACPGLDGPPEDLSVTAAGKRR